MAVGTGLIAFTPTYADIGAGATVVIVIGRLLQGFSAGGEVGTVSAVLLGPSGIKLSQSSRTGYGS